MKRFTLLISTCGLLSLASCAQLFPPDSHKEARTRWGDVRAKLKYELAAEQFSRGNLDEAGKSLDESLALNPKAPNPQVLRAKILLERGQTAAASEALDIALHNGGDTPETDYLSGLIAQRYNQLDNALAWYQRASQRDSMNAPYVVAVAETLVALDRASEALDLVRSRWTDFEQNTTLRALAGDIYMMLARYEEAADAYREAARMSPEDQRLQYQLGMALAQSNHPEEAATVLTPLVERAEQPEASALAALGRARLTLNQPEVAKPFLKQAAETEQNNARYWALLAQASLASNDLLTARRAAGRAVQVDPAGTDNAILLAYVCCAQRDYPAAIGTLQTVVEKNPTDLLALYLLAQAGAGQGATALVRDCCERALRVDPGCKWAHEMLSAQGTANAAARGAGVASAMRKPGRAAAASASGSVETVVPPDGGSLLSPEAGEFDDVHRAPPERSASSQ